MSVNGIEIPKRGVFDAARSVLRRRFDKFASQEGQRSNWDKLVLNSRRPVILGPEVTVRLNNKKYRAALVWGVVEDQHSKASDTGFKIQVRYSDDEVICERPY